MLTWIKMEPHVCETCVHQHGDGSWWFMDEVGEYEFGAFSTAEDCRASFNRYVGELNAEPLGEDLY